MNKPHTPNNQHQKSTKNNSVFNKLSEKISNFTSISAATILSASIMLSWCQQKRLQEVTVVDNYDPEYSSYIGKSVYLWEWEFYVFEDSSWEIYMKVVNMQWDMWEGEFRFEVDLYWIKVEISIENMSISAEKI